jgi:hypothetical protein
LQDAAGARTIRPMKFTLSSRPPVVFMAVATLALTPSACRRQEIRLPTPDTASGRAEPVDPGINSAQQLVEAMRERYDGRWYSTLTFVQASTFYRPDGSVLRSETWPESAMMPGRLRIDIGNPSIGNAVIYANDTVYQFQQRRLISRQPGNNPLQLLGFDVYHLPPSRTLEILASLGYDLSMMHRTTHDGRDYYVVGARPGDLKRKQFWVDADRLLLWRVLEPWLPTDSVNVREIRFQDYKQHGGGWVAEEVDFLRNGTRYFFEKYRDVRTDVQIDPALFDPRQFTTAKHWYREPARTGARP